MRISVSFGSVSGKEGWKEEESEKRESEREERSEGSEMGERREMRKERGERGEREEEKMKREIELLGLVTPHNLSLLCTFFLLLDYL